MKHIHGLAALLIWALLASTQEACTTTYYFSTSGNDSNTGLSPTEPKQSLQNALPLMIDGNVIRFKRGDAWYNPNYVWDLSGKANFTIDAYGKGKLPIISNMELIAGPEGWMQAGPGIWRHATRMGIKTAACFVSGESMLKVPSSSDLTARGTYAVVADGASHFVHVCTGGGAPDRVEILAALDGGGGPVLKATRMTKAIIRNMDFHGGVWMALHFTAPTTDVLIESCQVTRMRSYGILFEESADPTARHDAPQVRNCHIDKTWSATENTKRSPPGDGILFKNAVESGVIRGNTVVDAGHSGIAFHAMSRPHHGVRNSLIERNEVYGRNSNYLHAISLAGYDEKCSYNVVRRNYAHDFKVTCHISGNNNMIYSNVFRNVDVSPTKTKQGWAVDWVPWRVKDGESVACHDNLFAHNTLYDCEENPIMVGQFSPAVFGTGNVIMNNLIVKWGRTDHLGRLNFAIKVASDSSNVPVISHNGLWNSSAGDHVLYVRGSTFTAAEFGHGNRQEPPHFVNEGGSHAEDYRLGERSPYRSGGQVIAGMESDFVDYDGYPWDPNSPSIGAFQYRDSVGQQRASLGRNESKAAR